MGIRNFLKTILLITYPIYFVLFVELYPNPRISHTKTIIIATTVITIIMLLILGRTIEKIICVVIINIVTIVVIAKLIEKLYLK
jgi:hypothetical protein